MNDPLNIAGIEHILAGVFGIAVMLVAIRAIFHAFRSGWAAALTAAAIVMIGATVYGLAVTGEFAQLGTSLMHALLNP